MTNRLSISFVAIDANEQSTTVLLVEKDGKLSSLAAKMDKKSGGQLTRGAAAADFSGRRKSTVEILGARDVKAQRIILAGLGDPAELGQAEAQALGGAVYGAIAQRKTKSASIIVELKSRKTELSEAELAAWMAQGALLRSYRFDKYFTKATDEDGASGENGPTARSKPKLTKLIMHVADPKAASRSYRRLKAVADGVFTARDLVNEPANSLGPLEFAAKAKALEKFGLAVDILDEKALKSLKMGALLSVGQGSARPSRVAVMKWFGARSKKAAPLAFIGKGVVFDTGGISIKPASGMEDMKGDMGGAACVTGLMQSLAERKAPVNAVGVIGLVENMPSSKATRPGDIVTSMSGQTIEVINTDAEGRLVLADIMTYAQQTFKPAMMIDLATLTGAILVALGKDHAGLFSNDDELAEQLSTAGEQTGEKVWRLPMNATYNKLINSKTADMKNVGGRLAGSITAAQFLQRFVSQKELPWAHLDIAGTAMASPASDTNCSWGAGWGVQLLDRLVADYYE